MEINCLDRESLDIVLVNQLISIVPTVPKSKTPVAGLPLSDYFEGKRRATLSDLDNWLKAGYDRAAIVGKCSDCLIALDFDSTEAIKNFFDKSIERVAEETFTVKTHRGYSVWVKDHAADFRMKNLNFRPNLEAELFISHHLIACPLNTHPTGELYEGPLGTDRIESKENFAHTVLERMGSLGYVRKSRSQVEDILKGVPVGQRNNAGFTYARYLLFEAKLDPSAVFNELRRWNLLNYPPLPDKDIETIFKSAINYPLSSSRKGCSSRS